MNELDASFPKRHCNTVPETQVHSVSNMAANTKYRLYCRYCGLATELYLSKEEAIRHWNEGDTYYPQLKKI